MRNLLLALLTFLQVCNCANAATAPVESPDAFIRRFYRAYIADFSKNVYWFDSPKKLSPYFDPALIDLLLRDEVCKEVTREICAIDSDPIIDAQDYDEKYPYSLAVTKVKSSPVELKVVSSDGMWHFDGGDRRTIYFSLKNAAVRWVITDISYPDGRSLTRQLTDYKPNFDAIDDFLRFMEKASRSKENKEARIVRHEGKMHYVLFTLESGMNYRQHLAALQSMDGGHYSFVDEIVVGGRGERGVEGVRAADGKVVLTTKEYGPRDPICCPSVPGKLMVRVIRGKLVKE